MEPMYMDNHKHSDTFQIIQNRGRKGGRRRNPVIRICEDNDLLLISTNYIFFFFLSS